MGLALAEVIVLFELGKRAADSIRQKNRYAFWEVCKHSTIFQLFPTSCLTICTFEIQMRGLGLFATSLYVTSVIIWILI